MQRELQSNFRLPVCFATHISNECVRRKTCHVLAFISCIFPAACVANLPTPPLASCRFAHTPPALAGCCNRADNSRAKQDCVATIKVRRPFYASSFYLFFFVNEINFPPARAGQGTHVSARHVARAQTRTSRQAGRRGLGVRASQGKSGVNIMRSEQWRVWPGCAVSPS